MNVLNQNVLDKYVFYLKNVLYKGKIEKLELEYIDREPMSDPYIYLVTIKIKQRYRNQGYGRKVMNSIVRFADKHNEAIILFATNMFGSELTRLYKFYRGFGFFLRRKDNDGKMIRYPKKHKKICNKTRELSYIE
jgi:GNAT superfamily N-acetyltransferase